MSSEDTIGGLIRRVDRFEAALERIGEGMERLAESTEAIVRLEERHAQTQEGLQRAFHAVEAMDDRVRAIEAQVPEFRRVTKMVFAGITGIVGAVGIALLALVIK